jgi:hypothetical protein
MLVIVAEILTPMIFETMLFSDTCFICPIMMDCSQEYEEDGEDEVNDNDLDFNGGWHEGEKSREGIQEEMNTTIK